ncbi:MAG: DEAD/DEAH box helicase [Loktanella sp.]|nr:DEAD/DEAH box helicase [Loktanella sp.]
MFAEPVRKTLRPYQLDALAKIKNSILAGNRRIVTVLPTGAGKTLLASHIVAGALDKGGKVVFCAPMITLIDQTIGAFEAEGINDIGAIQASHPRTNWQASVQVASVQTLQRRDAMPPASVVLVDECHVYSKAIVDWMAECPDLVFIGLSATPGRTGMAEEWQDLVVGVTTSELIAAGYLSRFTVYAPSTADLSGVKIVAGEYQTSGAEAAMQDGALVGDILQNYITHGENRPTLGFAVSIAHAQRMAEEFTNAGIPSAYVEARTDTLERQAIQAAFRRGDIRVIWSVRTMTTGVDLPVSGIIDAAPTRSSMLHQQKIGRGLRVNDGTEDLKIWDHAGNTLRLGFVTDLDWSELPSGKREVKKVERKEPLPKECANCATLMQQRVKICPCCGEERKPPNGYVETEDGELVAINAEVGRAEVPTSVKQDWYQMLIGAAIERGKKPGMAYFQYKEKFGVFPSTQFSKTPKPPTAEVRSWVKSRAIAYAKAKEKRDAA